MASTSSSASLLNHTGCYDVFLSFRGEDTRNTFTDHLYGALVRAGLRTFRDNDEIDRGQQLKPEIDRAIKESRSSIVVLSANYANSSWCLEELVLILERRRSFHHFVLPVFYHVEPSDVKKHRKSFAIKVEDGVEGSKWTEYNVNRWKAALKEVAVITGVVVSGPETGSIAEAVDAIKSKLDLKRLSTPAHLVGMDTRAISINSWLKNEQSGGNILAICGMGGSGKSTLAQFIYNSNMQNFEGSSYVEEIGNHYKHNESVRGLQEQLLTDINGGKIQRISSVAEGTPKIEQALQVKRVLIVLDDIDDPDQLEALLGTPDFHPQTKIIITTRLLDVDPRCEVREVDLLNAHDSLELLSWHAFGTKEPKVGFKELALQIADYCAGNPLALKVVGASLSVRKRKRSSHIEFWKSTLNSLNSLTGDLDSKIQGILRKSYDSLPHDSNKELFLDIAFFFIGEYENEMAEILEHDWHAKSGIVTLIDRCLLTISPSNQLMMHQLLQEMAKNIVLRENKDPAKRSRVSQNCEAYRLLKKGEGSESIVGLALDMRKLEKEMESEKLAFKTDSLRKMDKLRLLQLKYVKLTGSYENFPELRWLYWHGCHLKTIPSDLLMSSLVAIDMSYGKLKIFKVPAVLISVKILILTESRKLVSIHHLSRLPNLEKLFLWNCISLTHVCETNGGLESLSLLDFKGCINLWKVFSDTKYVNQQRMSKDLCTGGGVPQQSFRLPGSLKFLHLDHCKLNNNSNVPLVLGRQSLLFMDLSYNRFETPPNNINLKFLQGLDLSTCVHLKSLPILPSTLEELYVISCFSLKKITFESGRFRLRKFEYEGSLKLSEVQGLFKLVHFDKLGEADLGQMQWIKAYNDFLVVPIGDDIIQCIVQERALVLYEYGIVSTVLSCIKDDSKTTPEHMSSSSFLSFRVPSFHKKCGIRGLNIISSYRRSGTLGKGDDTWALFTKVSNTTKSLTWMYNPVIYCKSEVVEDVWLSYWPIGNILDTGDEVHVSIFAGDGLMVSECRASLVYMEDEEVDLESRQNNKKEEEVIGGDLSEFELTRGVYYLCRRDFFKWTTPDWLNMLVGDASDSTLTELRGWRKSYQTQIKYPAPYPVSFPRKLLSDNNYKFELDPTKDYVPTFSIRDFLWFMPKYPRFETMSLVSHQQTKKNGGVALQCPMLTSTNYNTWAIKMEAIMDAQGVWQSIKPTVGVAVDERKNKKARALILQAWPDDILLQVAQKKTTKEVWDSLKVRYLGADQVQKVRLHTLKSEFDALGMKEGKTIDDLAGKLSDISSSYSSLGTMLGDTALVRELLDSVSDKFLQLMASIEQYSDIDTMPFDEAIRRLKAYELRLKLRTENTTNEASLLLTRTEGQNGQKNQGKDDGRLEDGRANDGDIQSTSNDGRKRNLGNTRKLCMDSKDIDSVILVEYPRNAAVGD